MKLLNDQILIINTYDINNPQIERHDLIFPTSGSAVLLESKVVNSDIWYCMLTNTNSLKFYNILDLLGEHINQVMDKTAVIVLDMPFEPFLDVIDTIYEEVVIKHNIPPSQIIFQSNMRDAGIYNQQAALKYNRLPIKLLWFSALEYWAIDYMSVATANTLSLKPYDKKFLNLNRRWRSHRPLLTLLLYHKGLLDQGFVSFGPCEANLKWDRIWNTLQFMSADNLEITNAIRQSESIKDMAPLYLDTDELHTNRAELTDSTTKYYEDSYFSVISETTFYYKESNQNSRFITEKTFKAIIMNHPFILVSIPKSLEVLKELGYKTFSPWIDESYDQEMDDNKRIIMVVNEIERLCNLSQQELEKFLVATKEICSYNYNLVKNKKTFIHEL
jgi:hypothetical protein